MLRQQQLMVLRRQVVRPRYTPTDRIVLASLALLSRDRWAILLVTRQRCCARTPLRTWSAAAGPIAALGRDAAAWTRRSWTWYCVWRGRAEMGLPQDRGGVPQARRRGVRDFGAYPGRERPSMSATCS